MKLRITLFARLVCLIGLIWGYVGCDRPQERVVDVDAGGHLLHLLVAGDVDGRTTVVLESGLPGGLGWNEVRWGASKFARVITYDRAGIGLSEPGTMPHDADHVVEDLHAALHNAGIPAPYILVGQSMGGAYVRVFGATYPHEVAGILLVDPVHVELYRPMDELRAWFALHHPADWSRIEQVATKAPEGSETMFVSIARDVEEYIDTLPEPQRDGVAKEYWSFVAHAPADNIAPDLSPGARNEFKAAMQTFRQATEARPLPHVPIVLIAAGQPMLYSEVDASLSPSMRSLHEFQRTLKLDDYKRWVDATAGAKLIVARHSGHNVQTDNPQLVINTIREMIDALPRTRAKRE